MNDSIRAGIIVWERRRIWFNILIGLVGIFSSFMIIDEIGITNYLGLAVLFGVSMNICYSLGPLLEIYAGLFTKLAPERWRNSLFLFGLIITVLFTVVTAFDFVTMVKSGNYPPPVSISP